MALFFTLVALFLLGFTVFSVVMYLIRTRLMNSKDLHHSFDQAEKLHKSG